jgi:hypothetical protein
MKKLIVSLLSFTALCSIAVAADVVVRAVDFTTRPLPYRRVMLTPEFRQAYQGTNLVNADAVAKLTDNAGVCTFTNVLSGYYRLNIQGTPGSGYRLAVPTNTGSYSAVSLLATSNAPYVSPQYLTTVTGDARYAPLGSVGSGGTGQTNWPASAITNKIQLSQIELSLGGTGETNAIAGWVPWWTNNGVVYSIPVVTNLVPTPAGDADVLSYISRSGITSPTEISAVSNLVTSLKSDGTWTNLVAVYPLLGATAGSAAVPIQSGVSNITWSGSLTYNAGGVTGDGASGYGRLPYGPGNWFGPHQNGQSLFCSWTVTEFDMGTVLGAFTYSSNPDRGVQLTGYDLTVFNSPQENFSGSAVLPKTRSLVQVEHNDLEIYDWPNGIWDMSGTFVSGARNTVPGMTNNYAILALDFYNANESASQITYHSSSTVHEVIIGGPLRESNITTLTNALASFESTLGR